MAGDSPIEWVLVAEWILQDFLTENLALVQSRISFVVNCFLTEYC